MSELLALDPSIVSCGTALFLDGQLVACARVTDPSPSADRGARALSMAQHVVDWFSDENYFGETWDQCRTRPALVVEWQQVYTASRSKGDPNDLISMGFVSGAVAGLLQPSEVVAYLPAEWCKLPKVAVGQKRPRHKDAFITPRGKRIMSRLTDEERALVPQYHDSVDAVGIGLHHLGRLAPRKVYPGATR